MESRGREGVRACFEGRPFAAFGDDAPSGLLGGVLNGETLSSKEVLCEEGATGVKFVSAEGATGGFLAKSLGLSARLTGGGTGETFEGFPLSLLSDTSRASFTALGLSIGGVATRRDGLLDSPVCPRLDTAAIAESRPPCRLPVFCGGERGDSTVKVGFRADVGSANMDSGRAWGDRLGDADRLSLCVCCGGDLPIPR